MKKIPRKEALEQGLKHYFTGKPCKYEHIDMRQVSDWTCVSCNRIRAGEWGKNNRDKTLKTQQKWKLKNPDWREKYRFDEKVGAVIYQVDKRVKDRKPLWASDKYIALVYKACALLKEFTGIDYVVDHVIPLRGKLVSGLHTHTNLQIIKHAENSTKHNKYEVI